VYAWRKASPCQPLPSRFPLHLQLRRLRRHRVRAALAVRVDRPQLLQARARVLQPRARCARGVTLGRLRVHALLRVEGKRLHQLPLLVRAPQVVLRARRCRGSHTVGSVSQHSAG
jgi:hypothetical protein